MTPPHAVRKVSILVPTWNGQAHLPPLLEALRAQLDPGVPWEVLLFDNGSTDGSADWVRREHPRVRVVEHSTNLGFAVAMNRLVEAADGDAIALLNNDTRPAPEWLAALVEALASAPADVAGIAGRIVDWEGQRLDFGRGVLTFDGHAFQLDFRRPLASARLPRSGDEALFACGGNALFRKSAFREAGGFDERYFAYLEDVDLGWRIWSGGGRILHSAEAIVHHRSSATSDRLGVFRRGFLFERNALWTAYKNYETEVWRSLSAAIFVSFLARTEAMLAEQNPGGALLRGDPFAPEEPVRATAPRRESLPEKWRRHGTPELARRAARKAARIVRERVASGSRSEAVVVDDPRSIAQLRAASSFIARLDVVSEERARIQSRRRRSDREIFERFPLVLVPTYPGDERLFASAGFASLLPDEPALARRRLDEMMEWKS